MRPPTSASLLSRRIRTPALLSAALPIRALPAHRQLAPAHPAGQPAGHLERPGPAALEQQLHHQHQHADELLARRKPPTWRNAARPSSIFSRSLSVNGAKVAETNYGCRGWCSHHNTDLWAQAAPVGNFGGGSPSWANFALSGPWLCTHLWEHYAFGGDLEFLRETAYPIMKGAAEFCLDWLIEDGEGHLVTCPSVSCENVFVTEDGVKARDQHGDHLRYGHHRAAFRELHRRRRSAGRGR